jgi:hypothetical protein
VTPSLQENRLRKFASFFKSYMGVMPLVTAAVAPLLTLLKAIPVFESEKTTLATYSGLLGFLLLAWVFYARQGLAKMMLGTTDTVIEASFPQIFRMRVASSQFLINALPLILILLSVYCYVSYLSTLGDAIEKARLQAAFTDLVFQKDYLEQWGQRRPISFVGTLQLYYLGIFLSAELAFVIMALREYIYGVAGISEAEILGRAAEAKGSSAG